MENKTVQISEEGMEKLHDIINSDKPAEPTPALKELMALAKKDNPDLPEDFVEEAVLSKNDIMKPYSRRITSEKK